MRHDIVAMYGGDAAAADRLIEQKIKQGKYRKNPELDDPKFNLYWVRTAIDFEKNTGIEEESELQAEAEVDNETAGKLEGAGGLFALGRGLAVPGLSALASANFMDDMAHGHSADSHQGKGSGKGGKGSKKTIKNDGNADDGAAEAAALSPLERASKVMVQVMKQAQEARAFSVSLAAHKFSSELVSQMASHAGAMEKCYTQLQQLVLAKVNEPKVYINIFRQVEIRQAWYTPRQRVAQTMSNSVKVKASPKAKASAKSAAAPAAATA